MKNLALFHPIESSVILRYSPVVSFTIWALIGEVLLLSLKPVSGNVGRTVKVVKCEPA
jgi:hypothetical protein